MSTTRRLRIKDRAGRVLLGCLVVSVVAGVFWIRRMAVDDQTQAPAGFPVNDTKAEMVISDFRHVETRMDRTIWILESARAEVLGEKASLYTVKVTWFGEPGEIAVIVTSKEGNVDFRDRKAELRGAVRVERADGAVLHTEEIFWDQKTKFLRAPLPVVITTPNFTFQGDSLKVNLATERITIRGRVRGEIRGSSLLTSQPS